MMLLYAIILIYCLVIAWLNYGFTKIKKQQSTGLDPKTHFTIVVPFRDEAENLPILLNSISALNYPIEFFEVILIDDDSEESFCILSQKFNIQITKNIRVSNSPKKDAITTAMQHATNQWIITTDADCIVPKNWLQILDNYIQLHDVSMIAGAVSYQCNNSFLDHFQQLDLTSLQGATIGSFGLNKGFMCNGANFAYTKSLFKKLNGFEGNNKIASGDDVFLLQKAIINFPEQVHYLKADENIIITKPTPDWRSLFYQRVRWAAKTGSYQSTFGKSLGILVFLANLSVALAWILCLTFQLNYINLLSILTLKFILDSILLYQTNSFLTNKQMRYFILSNLWYPFFSTSVALYSLLGSYEWKGRQFSK
ncbi:glycosyltransferase [Flavobacterium sp. F-65]|uniref:Glycosyltransferase n=1 Tax=Flavobacterium pisciphilum TaxID=2893755 RepID=A0ABS8MTE6_9FLAO|nr:glycosyltransferase [Flavobacterium sp. F-65]MCC9072061.1 glycosyltransferase [Flavobacterium sp. F-65]